MPPEESTPQQATESPSPAAEAPVPAVEPAMPPETPPAPAEAVPAPETVPASAEATMGTQATTPTAQIPPNEPIRPPSAAAPVQTGILHTARDLLIKARVAIQDRKRKKRDKIMQLLLLKLDAQVFVWQHPTVS